MERKSQIGIEYLIIVGFITLAIMSIVVLAFFYSGSIKDRIRLNQVESFATQLVSSAESVFFAGEPSKTTIKLYLPDGVESISIETDAVVVATRVSSGIDKRAYDSKVMLNGSVSPSEGTKKLTLEAKENFVNIS